MIFVIGVLLPATPIASNSPLFSKITKDSMLENVKKPRIIFVGGSNLSLGLNSKLIKDSLNLNPINTGIHASLGLVYMMDSTLKHIKKGDVVVVVPEYQQFFGDVAYGGEELMRTVCDVKEINPLDLSLKQIKNCAVFIPKYALSKFKPSEYFYEKVDNCYTKNSFNKFGDSYKHWDIKSVNILTFDAMTDEFNEDVMQYLVYFNRNLQKKGAKMFISFPPYQEDSYNNCVKSIKLLESEYKKNGFSVLGTPEQYKMKNELMFDTPYHLSRKGVTLRTQLLIKDLIHQGNLKNTNE